MKKGHSKLSKNELEYPINQNNLFVKGFKRLELIFDRK